MKEKILIAIDSSDSSSKVLAYGIDQDRYFRIHGNFGADAAEDKFCNSVHAAAADEDHASFGFFGGGQDLLRGVAN